MHINNDINILFTQLQSTGIIEVAPWLFKILGDFQDLLFSKIGQKTSTF
jgi:hypothetical protein